MMVHPMEIFLFKIKKKELFRINGVESISLNFKDDKDFSKFVFLGRNAEEKGLVDAINYFSLVSKEIKNSKLIVMGIDEEEGSHICLRLKLNDLKEKKLSLKDIFSTMKNMK